MTYQPEKSIDVGDFLISPGIAPDCVWIARKRPADRAGEGGDFKKEALSDLLGEFYDKHF